MASLAKGAALDLLLSPPILFFALGVVAVLVRSDLDIPRPVVRLFSIYLLISIGVLGGYKVSLGGLDGRAIAVMVSCVVASFALPFATYWVLRFRLSTADAAAVAATFGSISAVTFITGVAFLESRAVEYSGYMVAAMALMESPAIVSAVVLARIAQRESQGSERRSDEAGGVWREALFNGPVVLLVGSMVIGAACGQRGWDAVSPFMEAPFQGVLCLFLLDMGLVAARRFPEIRSAGWFLVGFGVVGAIAQGMVGVLIAWALDVGAGDALLIAVLFGSASYIAVPAAMRLVLPEANPSIYITVALAVTFPFNIIVGIPMYNALITTLGIGA